MRRLSSFSFAVALVILLSMNALGQQRAAAAPASALDRVTLADSDIRTAAQHLVQAKTQQSQTPPMPLVAPIFIEDAQFTSSLGFVNSRNAAVNVNVVLRDLRGNQIAQKMVSVPPVSKAEVSIKDVLDSVGSSETIGSVVAIRDAKTVLSSLTNLSRAKHSVLYRRRTGYANAEFFSDIENGCR